MGSLYASLSPSTWTFATRMGLSIVTAAGLYGVSFGALAVAAGLSVGQAMALSLLMFTGGSQFAFIGVIAGGGLPSAALGAAGRAQCRVCHANEPHAATQGLAQVAQRANDH